MIAWTNLKFGNFCTSQGSICLNICCESFKLRLVYRRWLCNGPRRIVIITGPRSELYTPDRALYHTWKALKNTSICIKLVLQFLPNFLKGSNMLWSNLNLIQYHCLKLLVWKESRGELMTQTVDYNKEWLSPFLLAEGFVNESNTKISNGIKH